MANEEQNPNIDLDNYCAISIDTSTFQSNGYNFNNKILSKLNKLVSDTRSLLISEIVYKELEKHLINELTIKEKDTLLALKSLAKLNDSILEKDIDSIKEKLKIGHIEEVVKKKLEKFITESKSTILKISNTDITKIISDYFNETPPFENKKNKKNEFPDAIILNSLEKYARSMNKKILIVSGDNGWKRFADTSEYLDYVDELSKVLAALYPLEVKSHVSTLIKNIFHDEYSEQYKQIFGLVKDKIQDLDIIADASADNRVESEGVDEIELETLSLLDLNSIEIISYGNESVNITMSVNLDMIISVPFGFYYYDSIDKEEIYLGSESFSQNEHLDTTITLIYSFEPNKKIVDLNQEDLMLEDIELSEKDLYVDFGYIEQEFV